MHSDQLVGRLVEHGLDGTEAARKRSLYQWLLDAFPRFAGSAPTNALWVPGRIEVFGKHTDYAGGHSLVATVPRGFGFLSHRRPDAIINLKDVVRDESFTMDSGGEAGPHTPNDQNAPIGWRRYAATVVRRLSRNFPGARLGADIMFASDLPPASGMSSSSALMVGLAETLVRLLGIQERPEWIQNIRGPAGAAGYYACIENGMSFGTLSGDAGVGTHGGSEDHVAILCGTARELAAWRFVPIERVDSAALPADWTFVIASSGVAARKTGPAKDSYNRLSQHVRLLLEVWNGAETTRRSLSDAMTSDGRAPERLLELLRARTDGEPERDDLERRLTQFLREDGRVLAALQAVRHADADRIGSLADDSQGDAESLLRNQVPETIALAREARDLGAFAASSFGAGFGGSVWALVRKADAGSFAARWLTDYRKRFPTRDAAVTFDASPGPALMWIT